MTGSQIRAARALLGWSVRELAHRSVVSIARVHLFEDAEGFPSTAMGHLTAIQATFEAAGVEFTNRNEPGVKLRARGKKAER